MLATEIEMNKFGKHIPGMLRRQLISHLSQKYVETPVKSSTSSLQLTGSHITMERFHCALLFVDISGFTILSQRLNADSLRLHINAYFQKILEIVDGHGGEAIKFAGDALFITWQTRSNLVGTCCSSCFPHV